MISPVRMSSRAALSPITNGKSAAATGGNTPNLIADQTSISHWQSRCRMLLQAHSPHRVQLHLPRLSSVSPVVRAPEIRCETNQASGRPVLRRALPQQRRRWKARQLWSAANTMPTRSRCAQSPNAEPISSTLRYSDIQRWPGKINACHAIVDIEGNVLIFGCHRFCLRLVL